MQLACLRTKRTFLFLAMLVLILIAFVVFWTRHSPVSEKPLATAALGDGRILQIEAVTYGTNHRVGSRASGFIRRFSGWLPRRWLSLLEPKHPEAVINGLEHPSLVVWVNAISAAAGTNVDCQSIRVELVDEHGQHFASTTRSWFGGDKYWQVGHVFEVFPRTETKLTLQVVTWRNPHTNQMEFPNPHVVQPESWTAKELPQQKQSGDLNVVLTGLQLRTNGVPPKYWETRSVYWEPAWELRRGQEKIAGWDKPEWLAEDPTGNRGQQLGTNQPVLRYSATFYPAATNTQDAQSLAILPQTSVTNLQSILWWKQTAHYESNNILILGLFPAGSYVFSNGSLLTNPPVSMGPVRGGAPSGWTWQSTSANPLKEIQYSGHYSISNSIIYVSAPKLDKKTHLAMRLRDDQGRYWVANLDPAGADNGVYPFLVNLPSQVNQVTPELVVLKPVEAEFMVRTPASPRP